MSDKVVKLEHWCAVKTVTHHSQADGTSRQTDETIGYFTGDREVVSKFLDECGEPFRRMIPCHFRHVTPNLVEEIQEVKKQKLAAEELFSELRRGHK